MILRTTISLVSCSCKLAGKRRKRDADGFDSGRAFPEDVIEDSSFFSHVADGINSIVLEGLEQQFDYWGREQNAPHKSCITSPKG